MTPQQKIKWAILAKVAEWNKSNQLDYPCLNIDDLMKNVDDDDDDGYKYFEAKNELRCGYVETGLDCEYSRCYESKAVAMQMPDKSWVGWTYWYGGGKHGNPEEIDWIDDAYDVECTEEEKLVIVRTFSLKDQA